MPLLDAIRVSLGIYGTSPTASLSALARVDGFELDHLDRALYEERSVVRFRAMRGSVHAVPADIASAVSTATREDIARGIRPYLTKVVGDEYPRLVGEIEAFLDGREATASEIREAVDPDRRFQTISPVLSLMASQCRIVRARTTGGWRSDRHTYARWSDWVPGIDCREHRPDDARRMLARWYVDAYGPVTFDDLRWWAGWRTSTARDAAAGMELGREGDAFGLLDGVRLLPVWDVLMVAYRDRSRLLPTGWEPFVYDRMGNATSVVLDDHRVAGVWDLGPSDDPLSVKVAPLGEWQPSRWEAVAERVLRIGDLVGAEAVELLRCEDPVDLREAKRNTFLSPLKAREGDVVRLR